MSQRDISGQQYQVGYNQNVSLTVDAQDRLTTTGFATMDGFLPAYTAYYSALGFGWQISPDAGEAWITPAVATSSNQTFITLANPVGGGAVPLTTFYAGVQGSNQGNGATNESTLLAGVWSGFESRSITRVDGTRLKYWSNWSGVPFTAPGLVSTADGTCGAWSQFLIDVLRAWGGSFTYGANYKGIVIDENTPVRVTGILVGNWNFGTQNLIASPAANFAGYLWYNYNYQPYVTQSAGNWVYNWQPNPSVTYAAPPASQIPGQNSPNPRGSFVDHAVVQIGNILYDPSYGVTYQSSLANPSPSDLLAVFQSTAVAGYWFDPRGPYAAHLGGPITYFRPASWGAGVRLVFQ